MKALVLAAGFGTRMLPLTNRISKVCLPLAGVPALVRVLRGLRAQGVDSCMVNLHHGAESVEESLDAWGERPLYSPEKEILGTGGALAQASAWLAGGTFLLVNGDCSYSGFCLEEALRFHRERGAAATLVLIDMPREGRYGAVETDSRGRVVRIAGRPEGAPTGGQALHFCGIHIIEPELLTRLRPVFSEIIRNLYLPMIADGEPLYGFHTAFEWRDLGTPRLYLEAQFEFLRREAAAPEHSLCAAGCRLETGSSVGPLADLGRNVRLEQDCRVERSVLMAGASLGRGCRVSGCVMAPGVALEAGTIIENMLVAPGPDGLEMRSWVVS
ncbi:NDP-sugar synthase [bacterium]|nr:NDP-sugar synthase [bacterium]